MQPRRRKALTGKHHSDDVSLSLTANPSPAPASGFSEPLHRKVLSAFRLSPFGISFASVPADYRKALSSLPVSPSGRRIKTRHGPFAPETLLSFIAPAGHSAILLPSALFRVSSYRTDLLPRFLSGAYRTSPVSIVSLLPCRR